MVFVYHSFTTPFKFFDFYCDSRIRWEYLDKAKGFLLSVFVLKQNDSVEK